MPPRIFRLQYGRPNLHHGLQEDQGLLPDSQVGLFQLHASQILKSDEAENKEHKAEIQQVYP